MSARWLDEVLARHGLVLSSQQIDALAADIREAIPLDPRAVADTIRESARAVLVEKSMTGPAALFDIAAVAREIGNNAAGTVVLELQTGVAA